MSTRFFYHQKTCQVFSILDDAVAGWLDAMDDDDLREVVLAELDDIVIRGGNLPPVEGNATYWAAGETEGSESDPNKWHTIAVGALAIERHLREHPPVDEAQVKAIADLLDSDAGEDAISDSSRTVARFLVAHGVRVGGESDE